MKKLLKKIRYLSEYFIFLLGLKLLKSLKMDRAADICSYLARKIGPKLSVSDIARRNLVRVYNGEINEEIIIDRLWDNFGRFIGEFPHLNSLSQMEIDKRIEVIGLEHVEYFKNTRQPFLLFTGHFANWDLALKIASKLYPKFGVVYRHANNPYVNKVINHFRKDDNIHLIAKGPHGAKDLIKAIKSGYAIAMLVDQKMNNGIEVPFCGRPAMTPHAIAKFSLQFNYPIIPLQIIRRQGSYFKIIIHPPLKINSTGNRQQDCFNIMLDINQILEQWIKEFPGQWLWFHNRWDKT